LVRVLNSTRQGHRWFQTFCIFENLGAHLRFSGLCVALFRGLLVAIGETSATFASIWRPTSVATPGMCLLGLANLLARRWYSLHFV
jgi:hypothetical protein